MQKEMKKVILIVGASRGIGFATAQYLQNAGYSVYGTSTQSLSNDSFRFLKLDLLDETSIQNAVDNIIREAGRLDVVINSAAIGIYGPAEEVLISEAQQIFDVNVFGIMRVMQTVIPHFRKQGQGLMINISSMAAICPVPGSDLYAASKYALEGLTESMASYLQNENIHLVLLEPGPVNTQFIAKTSTIGSRGLPKKPYGKFGEAVFNWHKEVLSKGQCPDEIAELIYHIINESAPNLRYQTSPAMRAIATERFVDPTGNQFQSKMKAMLPEFFEG